MFDKEQFKSLTVEFSIACMRDATETKFVLLTPRRRTMERTSTKKKRKDGEKGGKER